MLCDKYRLKILSNYKNMIKEKEKENKIYL